MKGTTPFDLSGRRIWLAGHRGMVGSAIVRRLNTEPVAELITASSDEVDLTRQKETETFVLGNRPDVAIIAAARVGGIHANRSAQADFLYENLMISTNALRACQIAGVEKVAVLGSSCIYPAESPQPIREEHLLAGHLEETNEGYAIAKIAALEYGKMLTRQYGMNVISLMPTNLYGPGDNYDPETSHVLPALIRKTHEAAVSGTSEITLWGSGRPRREFLHSDDLADAVVFTLINYSGEEHLNVGVGKDISIIELAETIAEVVGWKGRYRFDTSMPDGVMRKMLDTSKLEKLGWVPQISLREGISATFQNFLEEFDTRVQPDDR
ncbi:MAG: GDP-L-fucose synthase [Acidimicrobiia bacterium]